MYLIKATNISLRLDGTDILQSISLLLYPGELTGLLGPSGCGKSSLVRVLLQMYEPTKGTVQYSLSGSGSKGSPARQMFGYVPQDDIVHRSLTVEQAFGYSYVLRKGPGVSRDEVKVKVKALLHTLDLQHRADTRIKRLSGGERKRVNLGIELLTDPVVLFLDEPTSGLDPHLDHQMMKLFRELTLSGRSLMVTTHILTNIEFFDTVFFLFKGHLVFGGTPAAALEYFQVEDHELIYTRVRSARPAQLSDHFRKSPFYEAFMQRKPREMGSPGLQHSEQARPDQGPAHRAGEHGGVASKVPVSDRTEQHASDRPVGSTIEDELQKLKERIRQRKEQEQKEE
ncbi:ABC transporter ATP-binding protein [bacterium]|nr:ABC transporter ATP-binding protein [bacterium]